MPDDAPEGKDPFTQITAGALAYMATMLAAKPVHGLADNFYDEIGKKMPMTSPKGTPLQELAEFTRAEVDAITDFAKAKGVKTPILSAGPGEIASRYWRIPGAPEGEAITLARASVPEALHELGHAKPILGSKTVRDTLQSGALMSKGLPGQILRAAIAANILRGSSPDDHQLSQLAYKHAPELMGATYAPMLLEEARATGHAIHGAKAIPGRAEVVRQMAPAFGTYLSRALAPMLAALVAKKVVEAVRGQQKEAAATAGKEVKAPGILRVGASAAWRMRPSAMKPKTTRPSTNPSFHAKATPKLKPPSNAAYHKDLLESLHNPQRGFRISKVG